MLVLHTIRKQGGLGKPINIMIAVDEMFKMIGYTMWMQFILAVLDHDDPLISTLGQTYCQVWDVVPKLLFPFSQSKFSFL